MRHQTITTHKKFNQFLDSAWPFFEVLSIDIETGGEDLIDYHKGFIVSVSLTNANDDTIVIVFNHPESELSQDDITALVKCLSQNDTYFLTWNGAFDLKWLASYYPPFIDSIKATDVKIQGRLLFEPPPEGESWRKDLSLKNQAIQLLGVEPWADINFKAGERAETTPVEQLSRYNAKDTLYTAWLYDYYITHDNFPGQLNEILQAAWLELTKAEFAGIPLRMEYLKTLHAQFTENNLEQEQALFRLAEQADITVDKKHKQSLEPTSKFFQKLMEKFFGEPRKLTNTGKPSWDKHVLLELAYEGEMLAQEILDLRRLKKAKAFLTQWAEKQHEHHLHPDFQFTTTRTGRTSCSNPNFQQIPRDEKLRNVIGFEREDNYAWIEADFSQIELRVAAYLFNERNMLQAFYEGKDLHQLLAAEITGHAYDECIGDIRTQAKIANFGFLYGMGAKAFVDYAFDSYGVKFYEDQAVKIRAAFFERWPGVARAHQQLPEFAQAHGYVEGLFGRIHPLPYIWSPNRDDQHKAFKRAVNYPVQGGASDLVMSVTPKVAQIFRKNGGHLVANIHDALAGWVPKENARQAARAIKKQMEVSPVEGLPLEVDVTVGAYWYDPEGYTL